MAAGVRSCSACRPVPRRSIGRARQTARQFVADFGRLLGSVGRAVAAVRAVPKLGTARRPRSLARRRHVAAGADRHPRRARPAAKHRLYARRADYAHVAVEHLSLAADVRRRFAVERRMDIVAADERRSAGRESTQCRWTRGVPPQRSRRLGRRRAGLPYQIRRSLQHRATDRKVRPTPRPNKLV